MSQQLRVNGKQYLQSNELASTFGYSADYLGKLAREEKILGTQIGRQWFIEPESLKTFLHKTEIQKQIRKEELSLKRKAEHLSHQQNSVMKVESRELGAVALAQALAVVMCGGLIGILGFASLEAGLQVADVRAGASESLALIGESVLPLGASVAPAGLEGQLAASSDARILPSSDPVEAPLIFTNLPEFPERTSLPVTASSTEEGVKTQQHDALRSQFSDEIDIFVDSEGNQFILPIFRNDAVPQDQFLVVPVNASEN